MKNQAVIIDVDGVLNSFSNRKFYAQFIMEVGRSLKHTNPNRKNIIKSIQLFKKSGANGLFTYLRCMSKNDEKFSNLCNGIVSKLNFNVIPRDKNLKHYLEAISKDKLIIIRTDGLKEIAEGVWNSVIGKGFQGGDIIISDIKDNDFKAKIDPESWARFADKYNIDLEKSILLDDSLKNINTASSHGVTGCNVTKESPLMKFITKIALDTLRKRMDKTTPPAPAKIKPKFKSIPKAQKTLFCGIFY